LPFLFVQLPNYADPRATSENSWAYFREGQARTLSIPNTGMAVAIDIGEANDIHPKNKQDVGRRLALLALGDVYKSKPSGRSPMFREQVIQGREVRLKFNHAEGGLLARGGEVSGFVISGADQKWFPANARIAGDEVILSSAEITAPVAVRYGWADNPQCNLYDRDGLPIAPFRTDSWK
jgi:sialate O-acetylesterase